jgi:phosphatidate cytidylyltransferase
VLGGVRGLRRLATRGRAHRPPRFDQTPESGGNGRAGRDVPVAIAVGLGLGLLILGSVLIYRPLFVALVAVAVLVSLWELAQALTVNGIVVPVLPVGAGGVAMVIAAYAGGGDALAVALALTAVAVMVWRMLEGPQNYLRDMTAGVLAALYLPFLASFAVLMLTPSDGAARVLLFFILVICSDTGGFVAGVRYGRHPMAPAISPKKSWEGLTGSVLAASLAGGLGVTLMLHGAWWQGVLVGLGTVVSATLGDLVESMIKRDLGIKDMGRLLPGHGGLMDRMDSLLFAAPMVWLLLTVLVAVR